MMVLADSAFCGTEFLTGVRELGHHAVLGVRKDRRLADGSRLDRMGRRRKRPENQCGLRGWRCPRMCPPIGSNANGNKELRLVLSTKAMSPVTSFVEAREVSKERLATRRVPQDRQGSFRPESLRTGNEVGSLSLGGKEPDGIHGGAFGTSEPGTRRTARVGGRRGRSWRKRCRRR